jgi:hypothetical protein
MPFTNEGAGGENYNTLFYLTESALEKGVIWTGSDCGFVHVTMDGGKTWNNVTPPGLPEAQINSIELSAFEKGTAYIAATRYKFNDYAAYAFKTTDYGKTWTSINNGIKEDDFLKVIREDKKNKNLLYGGSERGFYLSTDGGQHWQSFQRNLPVVPVTDLMIRDNDLVAATAGRAFWILDDLGAIQQYVADAALPRLITPKPGYKMGGGAGLPEDKYSAGQNAPDGIILDYFLPAVHDSITVKLTISDASGKVVRTFSNKKDEGYVRYPGGPAPATLLPAAKGHNRFLWDYRTATPTPDVKGVYIFGDYRGYALAPGTYTAKLDAGTTTSTAELVLLANPKISATAAAWDEQQKMLADITSTISEIHQQVNDLRKVKKQLVHHTEVFKEVTNAVKVVEEAKKLIKDIDGWEANIVESRIQNGQDVINWPSKLNAELFFIKGLADAADPRITQGIKTRYADLILRWNQEKEKLQQLKHSLVNYNQLYKSQGMEGIVL